MSMIKVTKLYNFNKIYTTKIHYPYYKSIIYINYFMGECALKAIETYI
jgi:hypothetical protein